MGTAALVTATSWNFAFIGPGLTCIVVAAAVFFTLRDRPQTVGLPKVTVWKELESPENGNRITYDTEIKGFGIRVTAAGSKAFVFNYRFDGNEKRATIGANGARKSTACL